MWREIRTLHWSDDRLPMPRSSRVTLVGLSSSTTAYTSSSEIGATVVNSLHGQFAIEHFPSLWVIVLTFVAAHHIVPWAQRM